SLRELYASRIGHYDAGNLRGSTLFLPTPASYSNSWDAFITFLLWLCASVEQFRFSGSARRARVLIFSTVYT
ncbi:hypothetical protein, partial [Escherichia coli]|uniref:hypothetical protein n=1 Tax=Escherichia coli TaxID=562 RepID=UPI001BC9B252